jgi:GDPmannose 4,6-dehydratase/GDP-L-fucose synthase
MPANLFGPADNFHPENSHVLPALLRRFDDAARAGEKEVVVWGSGTPRREFLYVDDMAEASLFVMDLPKTVYKANTQPMLSHINVGTGEDISIAGLAEAVARITGFSGRIAYDNSRPDGTMRKLMDVSRLAAMGWKAQTPFDDALQATYRWYLYNKDSRRT